MAATAAKMPDQGGTYTFQSKPHEGPPAMKFRDPYQCVPCSFVLTKQGLLYCVVVLFCAI